MSILYIFFFALLIYIAGFAPGAIIAMKLTLTTEERFAVSFGISFLLYYLLGFMGFIFHLDPYISYAFLILLCLCIGLYHKKIRQLLTTEKHHHYLLLFFLFFLVVVGFQALLPSYNGGLWYFDWFEHYFRSLFFLKHMPLDTLIGPFILPSRPPLFNIVVYSYMSVLGDSFWMYQIISSLLNISIILPCYLLCRNIFRIKGKYLFIMLSLILLINPAILTQITYTWTKALSAYYVLLGLYFYLKSRNHPPENKTVDPSHSSGLAPDIEGLALRSEATKGHNPQKMDLIFCAIFLSCAYLTHYSALPFLLIITIDFLLLVFRRKMAFSNLILTLSIITLLASPWLLWSISTYGVNATFFSNTTYLWQNNISLSQRLYKDLHNTYMSAFPILTDRYITLMAQQQNYLVRFYDNIFSLYLSNVPTNITFTLFFVLCVYLFSACVKLISRQWKPMLENGTLVFLCIFITAGFILAIPANPTADMAGIAHVTHLPISLLLICIAMKILSQLYARGNRIFAGVILCFFIVESVAVNGLRLYVLQKELIPPKMNLDSSILQVHKDNWNLKQQYKLIFLHDLLYIFR